MYYPRIKCKDCPGKLYTPGPEMGVNNFEVHLRNKLHREKVDERVHRLGMERQEQQHLQQMEQEEEQQMEQAEEQQIYQRYQLEQQADDHLLQQLELQEQQGQQNLQQAPQPQEKQEKERQQREEQQNLQQQLQQMEQESEQQLQQDIQQYQQLEQTKQPLQQQTQQQPSSSSEIKSASFTPEIKRSPPQPQSKTGPRPYMCVHPGCNSDFARYYDLQRHMKVHFPSMRFDCPYARSGTCGRAGEKTDTSKGGFTREDHFVDHLIVVHREDIPKPRKRLSGGFEEAR